jgi:acyl transferase domain-containing protein
VSIDRIEKYAGQLATYLRSNSGAATADVAHTLARRIGRGPIRAAVVGHERADLTAALTSLAQGNEHPGVVIGAPTTGEIPQPVWVFPGRPSQTKPTAGHDGSQESGDGSGLRGLVEGVPGFGGVIAELDPLLEWAAGVSLREAVLTGVVAPEDALPVAYGVQVALALAWRQAGVVPGAIVADGVGEVAGAVVAGALTATEGARVIAALARTPDQLATVLADLAPAPTRLPFYSAAGSGATPFGAEYWVAVLKQPETLGTTLTRATLDGYQTFIDLIPDALAFHAQLATLEVLGQPVVAPVGHVTDVPVPPWRST